ncbi:MAG: radical SAM protein [Candidatus Brockarchaeota archaeon]|nr:radical SAM protein [Candidatus Brockarchaeota archaeon]
MLSLEEIKKRKLVGITVLPTYDCNFNCSYCFLKFYSYKYGTMTEEVASATLEFAKKYVREDGSIWFFGGEPSVAWNIIKFFVEEVRRQKLKFNLGMTTNMYLLDEEKLKYLAERTEKRFGFLVSIDGLKEQHDKFRVTKDGRGTWDKVFENYNKAKKIFGKEFQVRWTFAPGTIVGLADAVKKYVEDYNIYNIALGAVFEVEWKEKDYEDFRKEMEKLRDYLFSWYRKGIPVNLMPERDGLTYIIGAGSRYDRCGFGISDIGINPKGEISTCHRTANSLVNSEEMKIGDVFNGIDYEKVYRIYKRFQLAPIVSENIKMCDTCIVKNICNGGCLAQNYDMFNSYNVMPEAECRYLQIVTEVFLPLGHAMLSENNEAFKRAFNLGSRISRIGEE